MNHPRLGVLYIYPGHVDMWVSWSIFIGIMICAAVADIPIIYKIPILFQNIHMRISREYIRYGPRYIYTMYSSSRYLR